MTPPSERANFDRRRRRRSSATAAIEIKTIHFFSDRLYGEVFFHFSSFAVVVHIVWSS